MLFEKGFLSKHKKLLAVPKQQIIVGVLLGLAYAFALYFFLIVIRESTRLLSGYMHEGTLYILSKDETDFYNFFFAFIAVLFAQAIVMSYWYDRPKKFLSKFNYRRNAIVNEHRFTNWVFLFWFTKISMTTAFLMFYRYYFGLYPEYKFYFLLLLLVLFLGVWTKYRFYYKNRALKFMVLSFLAVTTISYGLSKINLGDINRIEKVILMKNMLYKYNIDVPESPIDYSIQHYNLLFDMYISNTNQERSTPTVIISGEEFSVSEIQSPIAERIEYLDKFERDLIDYVLHIDKQMKMKDVFIVKNELIANSYNKISCAVRPTETESFVPTHFRFSRIFPLFRTINESKAFDVTIELRLPANDSLLLNGDSIEFDNLKGKIKALLSANPNSVFHVYVADEITFNTYLQSLIQIKLAIDELRDEYAQENFKISYKDILDKVKYSYEDNGFRKQVQEIKSFYPYAIITIEEE